MNKVLFCVDSDGCAMDTMTIKHVECFGPCLVKEWDLEAWEAPILTRWNAINLYTMTRGVNRFQGLLQMLQEVDAQYTKIDGIMDLEEWVDTTNAFSEANLKEAIAEAPEKAILAKALSWSQAVNCGIVALSDDKKVAFSGVKEALAQIKEQADLAIVSSANKEALEEEWERCEIMQYVDYPMAQDVGTKTVCIQKMQELGYEPEKILMIGDAQGDYKAAVAAGVSFYPILAGKEEESWKRFLEVILEEHMQGNYNAQRQKEELDRFFENLK